MVGCLCGWSAERNEGKEGKKQANSRSGEVTASGDVPVLAAQIALLASLGIGGVAERDLAALGVVQVGLCGGAISVRGHWLVVEVVHCRSSCQRDTLVQFSHLVCHGERRWLLLDKKRKEKSNLLNGPPSAGNPEMAIVKSTPFPLGLEATATVPRTVFLGFSGNWATYAAPTGLFSTTRASPSLPVTGTVADCAWVWERRARPEMKSAACIFLSVLCVCGICGFCWAMDGR